MKLAPIAVPYRVAQKSGSLILTIVILASIGAGLQFDSFWVLAAVGAVLIIITGYEVAYYRRFRYELTPDTFDLQSGVFSRREREIPYGRIQNVDISRNILQRLLGISAVNIETAGGGSTEASIQYVTVEEGQRLQREIRHYKRDPEPVAEDSRTEPSNDTAVGGTTDDGEADDGRAPASDSPRSERRADEQLLFELNPSELALAGVLSFDPRVPGVLIAVFTGSIPFVSPILPTTGSTVILIATVGILLIGAIVLAWIVGAVSAILNYWGFRLLRSGDELRYERGLLQQYSGTIPFEKIQAMTIEDNPLKRRVGYATLAVETAGYAPGQASGRGTEAAVPLASRDRVEQLAAEIDSFGTPNFSRPPKRIRRRYLARYLLALGAIAAALYAVSVFVFRAASIPWYLPLVATLLTPVAAHYKWLHRGYWLGENHVVTRNGFWNRETKIVAYYRIQTVIDRRTVFQRRWNVASVVVDTAGSLSVLGQDCAAVDIDDENAVALRTTLTERLNDALIDRRAMRRTRSAASPAGDSEPTETEPTATTSDGDEDKTRREASSGNTDSHAGETPNRDADDTGVDSDNRIDDGRNTTADDDRNTTADDDHDTTTDDDHDTTTDDRDDLNGAPPDDRTV